MNILREVYSVSADKMLLVYNGFGEEIPIEKRLDKSGHRQILFVGRLDEIKGLRYLIDAFEMVASKHADAQLTIIGDGDFHPYMVQSRKLRGRVVFLGKMDNASLEEVYGSAYIGVMPSFHEQCSYTAIEMMRHGIPVIGTDSTGLKEMLDATPYLCVHIDETDFSEIDFVCHIAELLDELLSDAKMYEKSSDAVRRQYQMRYTVNSMMRSVEDSIKRAFAEGTHVSRDYYHHIDNRMVSLIKDRPEMDNDMYGLAGIGVYLWWRIMQMWKDDCMSVDTSAALEKNLADYLEWIDEPDYEVHRREELALMAKAYFIPVMLMVAAIVGMVSNLVHLGIYHIARIVLSLAGVLVCVLLMEKQMFRESRYGDKVCSLFHRSDCNSVLDGPMAKIFGISWSEVGLGYFAVNVMLLALIPSSADLVAVVNWVAMLYGLWSVYYQWRIAKSWCVLCVIVQAIIWTMGMIVAAQHLAEPFVFGPVSSLLSCRSSQQYREGDDKELSLSAEATRKLAWGDEVTFEAEYKHAYADHELFGKNMTSQRLQVPFVDYRHEYDRAKKKENYYSVKAKYVVPFLKGPAVSLMYNPVHKRMTDCDNIFRLNRLNDWSVSANQPLRLLPSMADMMASCVDLGNTYNYKDVMTAHTLTLNVGQRKSTEKGTSRNVEFDFPLTLTHERMEYTRGLIDTIGSRDYAVLSPRISYESIWNDERYTFNASTSYLTSVANFVQLMPFRDDRNPLMVRENNPNLKHSWVYSAETSLSMRLRTYSQMLLFRASAEICGNQIANGFTFDPKTGVYTYRPENVNGNWNMNGYGNYSILFGEEQCFKFENNANACFIHSVDIASVDGSAQATLSKVNTTVVKDEASFAFSKKDLRVEILGSVTHRHTVSSLDLFEPINAIDFNYGTVVRYTIPLLKVTAQTDLRMYSRRGYGSRELNTDDLMWNATLSRAFMKGKLVVSADAIDILRNRDNMQYAVNAQGRTITWHRSMPSYVMLRVQWQFNYNPSKRR